MQEMPALRCAAKASWLATACTAWFKLMHAWVSAAPAASPTPAHTPMKYTISLVPSTRLSGPTSKFTTTAPKHDAAVQCHWADVFQYTLYIPTPQVGRSRTVDCIGIKLTHMPASSYTHADNPSPPTHAQDLSRQTLRCIHTHAVLCIPTPPPPTHTHTLSCARTHTPIAGRQLHCRTASDVPA